MPRSPLPRPRAQTARLIVAGVLAALAGTAVSVAAAGTITLGHDAAPDGGSKSVTFPRVQLVSNDPTDVLVAPRAGTITSYTVWMTEASSVASLKVVRETSPGTYQAVAMSPQTTVPVGESTHTVSLPVEAGDRIALGAPGGRINVSSGGTFALLNGYLSNPGDSAGVLYEDAGTVHLSAVLETPEASVSPSSLDFGEIAARDVSPTQAVTVTNGGTADLHVTRLRGNKAGNSLFGVSNDTCVGTPVAPGGTCTFDVDFAPLAAGTWTPRIEVVSDAPKVAVRVRGTGVAPIAAAPDAHDFGSVARGATSTPQAFTVRNSSDDPAAVTGIVKQGTGRSLFPVDPGTCTGTIAAGAACTVSVTFSPLTAGSWSPELVVQTDRGAARIALSGTGT